MPYHVATEAHLWIPKLNNRREFKVRRDSDQIIFYIDFICFSWNVKIERYSYIPEKSSLFDRIIFKKD